MSNHWTSHVVDNYPLDGEYWHTDEYEYEAARQQAEQDWADEWSEGYQRLVDIGVLSHEDDHTNINLTEIRRLLAMLGES